MRLGYFPKLALDGMRKNKRLYAPYIITCIGMVAMFYVIVFNQFSHTLDGIRGEDTTRTTLQLGAWVMAIFSLIFLFYTNSFLIRRRKKEFGLYNILGMGKANIIVIVFWETVFTAVISLLLGNIAGVGLSKLAELGLMNLLHTEINFNLTISFPAIVRSIAVFLSIFLLLFLSSVVQLRKATAINLLRSENIGEKAPKANWFLGVLGVLVLGVAYYLAVSVSNPIDALGYFFIAVILVIMSTYIVFVSGSVAFCKLLQKNKRYYYKSNHFVSVSSMVYRMKRNGAGLASVCILATMVLVMISSTTCLYFGSADSLRAEYPRDFNLFVYAYGEKLSQDSDTYDKLRELIDSEAQKAGADRTNILDAKYYTGLMMFDGKKIAARDNNAEAGSQGTEYSVTAMTVDTYNQLYGKSETLGDGEVLLYTGNSSDNDTVTVGESRLKIKRHLRLISSSIESTRVSTPILLIVMQDKKELDESFLPFAEKNTNFREKWTYCFDTDLGKEELDEFYTEADDALYDFRSHNSSGLNMTCTTYDSEKDYFYSMYGSLLYLGITLSVMFIFAAVLIIYYKQISEGYEDKSRFEIMQKVGMTKHDIKKSINSQLLTVFFIPLAAAGVHLAFAFPMIKLILSCFYLSNSSLFALTTLISFAAFATIYSVIYKITSNSYYRIVSAKE